MSSLEKLTYKYFETMFHSDLTLAFLCACKQIMPLVSVFKIPDPDWSATDIHV